MKITIKKKTLLKTRSRFHRATLLHKSRAYRRSKAKEDLRKDLKANE